MRGITKTLCSAVMVGAVGIVGCGNDDDDIVATVPGVDSGTYVQTWSIEGQRDASKCSQYGADRMRLVVYDEDGSVHATEFASCSSFSIRLTLLERRYTGAATFVNADGNVVSQTIPIEQFAILKDQEVTKDVNFSTEQMRY
jgi:hypothetical protein